MLLLGADEVSAERFKGAYKVYIGHHGDAGAQQADLVLPGAAYAEKHGTYVNTEGRVQRAERALFAPGEAREDWSILRAVSELAGAKLPFDSFAQLRAAMVEDFPQLGREGLIDLKWAPPKLDAKAEGPVRYPIGDFFLTNAICRAARPCSAARRSWSRASSSRRRRSEGTSLYTSSSPLAGEDSEAWRLAA